MSIRVAFLAWTQNNTDTDYSKSFFENIRSGWVITWLNVSWWSIQPWSALIEATRTSGETLLVPVIIDQAIVVDTTGTKKIYLEIDQDLLDDGSSMESDHTGVVSVQTAGSYPADNFLKIADVTSGVVTDEREFSRVKLDYAMRASAWKLLYAGANGYLQEVALWGSNNTYLKSNWASSAPEFTSISTWHKFTDSAIRNALSVEEATVVQIIADATDLTLWILSVLIDWAEAFVVNQETKTYRISEASSSVAVVARWNPFTLSALAYASKSKDVSAQETSLSSIARSSDGTKMYITGSGNSTVYQYTVSTAWDVSTASYASKSKDVSAQEVNVFALRFSSDGTKMYIWWNLNSTVYQYTLSTAWDVSTASYASKSKSVSAQESAMSGFDFWDSWTKMYVAWYTNDTIYQYTLSTAWDVSTASYASKSVATNAGDVAGFVISSDWLEIIVGRVSASRLSQYTLSTAWDVSTATLTTTGSNLSEDSQCRGLGVSADWSTIYVWGNTNDIVFQYDMASAFTGTAFATVL